MGGHLDITVLRQILLAVGRSADSIARVLTKVLISPVFTMLQLPPPLVRRR